MTLPGYIGKKCGMTQVFDADGQAVPVTVVELLPLFVTQLKTPENDGYAAVQVGYKDAKAKHLSKAEQHHLTKNSNPLLRHLKEFRVKPEALAALKVGDKVDALGEGSFLTIADAIISVTGKSIGKGFQGNIKRWGHHRGPMGHGSKSHRLTGSIGAGTTPGRVQRGLHMPGNMGNDQVTTTNLKVVATIPEKNVVLIKGSVPGVEGGLLTIKPKRIKWNNN